MFSSYLHYVFIFLSWISFGQTETSSDSEAVYLGCYKDSGHGNRLMKGEQKNFHQTLTPEVCNEYCFKKGFAFAGTQYSIECFCSKTRPPDNKKLADDECNAKCSGDQVKTCGGNHRLSIHSTGAKEIIVDGLATTDKYVGCYIDGGPRNRLMNGLQENFPDSLTPDECLALCLGKDFSYAGTQYRIECFCSKVKPSDDKKSDDSQCNLKCAGDDSKHCGGNNRLSVYRTGIKEDPSGIATAANYEGCYIDGGHGNRLMNGLQQNFPELTPNMCLAFCSEKGFAYSGTQHRTECFCSKTKPSYDKKLDDSQCNMKCAGDDSKICGGSNRLSVHKTGIKEDSSDVADLRYVGCFRDYTNGTRLMTGIRQDFPDQLTNEICLKFCNRRSYKYAGMQYGKECYCDNKTPSFHNYAREEDCNMRCEGNTLQLCGGFWKISMFRTGIAAASIPEINAGKYIGCYKDQATRHLAGFHQNFRNRLTHLKCTGLCYSMGFLYSGTQNSKECYCGDEHPNANLVVDESECSKPCSGDHRKMCGGDYRNSIRETGIPDFPAAEKLLGCYNDKDNQIFKGFKTIYEKTNSPRRCFNICWQLGYKYSGVEYGKECFCGNEAPAQDLVVNGDECNMVCSGDLLETCGASWRMAVYSIDFESAVQPLEVTHPSTTNRPTTAPTCKESETIVNGKKACKGEVIFVDEFKTPLGDKWQNVVMIPESPDNEFILLQADPKNCFISKNNLIIKPTIIDDDHVRNGSLQLKGCTGNRGTRECGYDVFSFDILPPVASARVNTRHSFNFQYGIVEIRAKLPIGDWLIPEIWLEPKDHLSGEEYYQSGRIRIAMSRGNQQLQCGNEDLGSSSLESGVMMGTLNDVRSRSVHSTLPSNWHDFYHTYTLIWKPDSISFKIDNDMEQEVVPGDGTLCEAIGFTVQQCAMWASGSKIAPFNNEFYISLGVSAGNSRDFPDNCVNRGKPKPWRNWEVKAMLKFWQDKNNWMTTWTDEKSALFVEYVRVTAL